VFEVRPLTTSDIAQCVSVLRSLPQWFGIENAIIDYSHDLGNLDGFAAFDGDKLVGFVGLKRYQTRSVEINVMGVLPDYRNMGLGTRLLEKVESSLSNEIRLIHMKTLAPSHPDESYRETRAFWEAKGFIPMDAHELWGDANPCQVMVKPR